MKQRGRLAHKTPLAVIDSSRGSRPAPPASLTESEAATWAKVVGCLPDDWFDESTENLVYAYCRHTTIVQTIDSNIDKVSDGMLRTAKGLARYDKLTAMRNKQTAVLLSLSRSMRITQQSIAPRPAGTKKRDGKKAAQPWDDD